MAITPRQFYRQAQQKLRALKAEMEETMEATPTTPISDFFMPIRIAVGDMHGETYLFEDSHLEAAIQTQLKSSSIFNSLTLKPVAENRDEEALHIEPQIDNPNLWALIWLKSARMLLTPMQSRLAIKQPGLSIDNFGYHQTIWIMNHEVYQKEMELEHSQVFKTYKDLFTWAAAQTSSDYFWKLANVEEEVPVATFQISSDGIGFD